MKKMMPLMAVLLIFASLSEAITSNYKINDEEIDVLFELATDVTGNLVADFHNANPKILSNVFDIKKELGENTQLTAGIIAAVQWVTGIGWIIPIHRIILGSSCGTYVLYCVTLSGCGILLVVDAILLLINSEGNQYIDNPSFIMW